MTAARRMLAGLALLTLALAPMPAALGQAPIFIDLRLEDPALDPAAPVAGDGVTFNATLLNAGTTATSAQVEFRVDGDVVWRSDLIFLGPGQRVNVSNPTPWLGPPGTHSFLGVADPDDSVPEADETNNEATHGFQVGDLPDLTVVALGMQPFSAETGETTTFTGTVRNAGDGPAGPFHVHVTVDGRLLDDTSFSSLAPGAEAQVQATWTAEQGDHTVRIVADALGELHEPDEANNDASLAFTVPPPGPLPDLVVVRIESVPAAPDHGDTVTFTAVVHNEGQGTAPATTTRFELDGTLLGEVGTPALAPGGQARVAAPDWEARAGPHTVRASADALEEAPESQESDNTLARALEVAPAPGLPDLVVEQLSVSPPQPFGGDTTQLTARVRNGGAADAGPFAVTFHLDGAVLGTSTVQGLAGGAAIDILSPTFTAQAGDRTARAEADAGQAVAEQSETNNGALLAFHVAALGPDLVVDLLETQPAQPRAGDTVAFVAHVRNTGDAAAGAFRVEFRVDGQVVGNAAVAGLAPGASSQARSDLWTAKGGAQRAESLADPDDRVRERSEANNAATRTLPSLGSLPNLAIASLTTTPEAPTTGQQVALTAVVANTGGAPSAPTLVRFLRDGVQLGAPVALGGLAAGARASVVSPGFEATGGAHIALAQADPGDAVAEEREDDNTATLRFEVPSPGTSPGTGVRIVEVAVHPAQPTAGEAATVVVVVRNDGATPADGVTVELRGDGALVGTRTLATLAPGASAEARFSWTPSAGDHALEASLAKDGAPMGPATSQQVHVAGALTPLAGPWLLLLLLVALGVVVVLVLAHRRRHGN